MKKHDGSRRAGTATMIAIERLSESPWNTHDANNDPEAKSLKESIGKLGVIQRLVVRPIYDGEDGVTQRFEIVDGHRRYWAAKALGIKELPCDMVDLDDAEAQARTLAANVQRIQNDPLLEAGLIGRMERDGMTRREIAAALGQTEGHVARRARLASLTEGWREEFRKAEEKPATALLEMIAAHEPGLQDEVLAGMRENADESASIFDEYDVEDRDFAAHMRKLDPDAVPFDLGACANCPNNTACHQFLFPDLADEDGATPMCQNASCYALKWNSAVDAEIERLKKRKVEVKEVGGRYDIPQYWQSTPNRERKNKVPYVYEETGLKRIAWSVAAEKPTATAMTAEEKAAQKAEKKRQKLVRSARDKMRDQLQKRFREDTGFAYTDLFSELGCMLLRDELKSAYVYDRLVDKYATVYGEGATCCLDGDEAEAYREEVERMGNEEEDDEEVMA